MYFHPSLINEKIMMYIPPSYIRKLSGIKLFFVEQQKLDNSVYLKANPFKSGYLKYTEIYAAYT